MRRSIIIILVLLSGCGSQPNIKEIKDPKDIAIRALELIEQGSNSSLDTLSKNDENNDCVVFDRRHKVFIILDPTNGKIYHAHPEKKEVLNKTDSKLPEKKVETKYDIIIKKKPEVDTIGNPSILFDGIHCISSTDNEVIFLLKCPNPPNYQFAISYKFENGSFVSKTVFVPTRPQVLGWNKLTDWPKTWPAGAPAK